MRKSVDTTLNLPGDFLSLLDTLEDTYVEEARFSAFMRTVAKYMADELKVRDISIRGFGDFKAKRIASGLNRGKIGVTFTPDPALQDILFAVGEGERFPALADPVVISYEALAGAILTASSEVVDHEAAKAIDGNVATYFEPDSIVPFWLQADFLMEVDLHKLVIGLTGDYSVSFDILYSSDGVTWMVGKAVSKYQKTDAEGNLVPFEVTGLNYKAKHFRFQFTKSGDSPMKLQMHTLGLYKEVVPVGE